ncbi:MAG: SCO family protein [Bacteroidota bacterium]
MTRVTRYWTPLLIATAVVVSGLGVGSTEAQAQRFPQVTQGAAAAPLGQNRPASAEVMPDAFADVGITERLGEAVPLDLPLVNAAGETTVLRDYLGADKPVVLAYVYHACPMLCSLVLDGLSASIEGTDLVPGSDYEVLAVSFDTRDTPADAAAARSKYLAKTDQVGVEDGWHFLTASEEAIGRLTRATGFGFKWDQRQQEYVHNAALIFLSPDGTITRYLYGIEYPPPDFRKAILEASEGTVGSTLDQILLYCFVYDPTANSYVLHALNVMKVGGLLTLAFVGTLLAFHWRRERRGTTEDRWADALNQGGAATGTPAPTP